MLLPASAAVAVAPLQLPQAVAKRTRRIRMRSPDEDEVADGRRLTGSGTPSV